jgi:hypothetical protein
VSSLPSFARVRGKLIVRNSDEPWEHSRVPKFTRGASRGIMDRYTRELRKGVPTAMSVTEELLQNNAAYAESFEKGDLPLPPASGVAVVACMDARLHVHKILGLKEGDAHVIRNAGGVITDDEIRSLTISQRLLGTHEIILIHHTDCGMLTFSEEELKAQRSMKMLA